jgi:hypothetical protein
MLEPSWKCLQRFRDFFPVSENYGSFLSQSTWYESFFFLSFSPNLTIRKRGDYANPLPNKLPMLYHFPISLEITISGTMIRAPNAFIKIQLPLPQMKFKIFQSSVLFIHEIYSKGWSNDALKIDSRSGMKYTGRWPQILEV